MSIIKHYQNELEKFLNKKRCRNTSLKCVVVFTIAL